MRPIASSQLAAVHAELEQARRSSECDKKQANRRDDSEVAQLDREVAKLRRQNKKMREQLESHASQVERLKQLQNQVTDISQQLEAQESENELLQQQQQRRAKGIAEQGLTSAQSAEMIRLQKQSAELQRDLRDVHQSTVEFGRQQQAQQLNWSRLCARRERLKKALLDGERKRHPNEKVIASIEEARKRLRKVQQERSLQKKKFQVRMHDAQAEIKQLKVQLEMINGSRGRGGELACGHSPLMHSRGDEVLTSGYAEADTMLKRQRRERAAVSVQAAARGRMVRKLRQKATNVAPQPSAQPSVAIMSTNPLFGFGVTSYGYGGGACRSGPFAQKPPAAATPSTVANPFGNLKASVAANPFTGNSTTAIRSSKVTNPFGRKKPVTGGIQESSAPKPIIDAPVDAPVTPTEVTTHDKLYDDARLDASLGTKASQQSSPETKSPQESVSTPVDVSSPTNVTISAQMQTITANVFTPVKELPSPAKSPMAAPAAPRRRPRKMLPELDMDISLEAEGSARAHLPCCGISSATEPTSLNVARESPERGPILPQQMAAASSDTPNIPMSGSLAGALAAARSEVGSNDALLPGSSKPDGVQQGRRAPPSQLAFVAAPAAPRLRTEARSRRPGHMAPNGDRYHEVSGIAALEHRKIFGRELSAFGLSEPKPTSSSSDDDTNEQERMRPVVPARMKMKQDEKKAIFLERSALPKEEPSSAYHPLVVGAPLQPQGIANANLVDDLSLSEEEIC